MSLAFGLLALVISLMTIAQSHTMAYVDEMTGEERIVHCGSMLSPTDLPDNVPAEHARSCDPGAPRNVLYAAGFAVFGGIAIWRGIRDLRTPRKSSS